jgi:hypothetical protein
MSIFALPLSLFTVLHVDAHRMIFVGVPPVAGSTS